MDFSARVLEGDDRHAVLLPGGNYPVSAPLLWYAGSALAFQGWTVHLVTWPNDMFPNRVAPIVTSVLDDITGSALTMIVGKSLGSLAMPLAVERDLPGVWLTPVLNVPRIAEQTRRLGRDHLLVGGTADDLWDSSVATGSGARVLEIADADHALQVEGDLDATLAAITAAAHAVDDFARELSE